MSKEDYPEFSRYAASLAILTAIMGSVIYIVLTLILFMPGIDVTNGIVGIVLFLLYASMMMLVFATGEFLAWSYYFVKPKPEATTRANVVNAIFLGATLLWAFAVDFMFLVQNLAYHFAVSVVITVIVYGAMVAYTFAGMWKSKQ